MDYEKMRAKLAKEYKSKLQERDAEIRKLRKEKTELSDRVIDLETQLNEKEEWIERLLQSLEPDQIPAKKEQVIAGTLDATVQQVLHSFFPYL